MAHTLLCRPQNVKGAFKNLPRTARTNSAPFRVHSAPAVDISGQKHFSTDLPDITDKAISICVISEISGLFFGYSPLVCTRLFVEASNSGEESSPRITLINANKRRSAFTAAAALSDIYLHSRSFALFAGNSGSDLLHGPHGRILPFPCPFRAFRGPLRIRNNVSTDRSDFTDEVFQHHCYNKHAS